MPAPTDLLAEQLANLKTELGSLRQDTLDQFRKMSDTNDAHLWRMDEKITSDLDDLKNMVATGKEAFLMALASLREDLARFQSRTDTLVSVANRILAILVAVAVTLIGTTATTIWNASRVYQTVESHSRRLDKVEKSLDYLPKIQESIDRLQKTIENQKPGSANP